MDIFEYIYVYLNISGYMRIYLNISIYIWILSSVQLGICLPPFPVNFQYICNNLPMCSNMIPILYRYRSAYSQQFPDIVQHFHIPSMISHISKIIMFVMCIYIYIYNYPDIPTYIQIYLEISRYIRIYPDISEYIQIHPPISRYI